MSVTTGLDEIVEEFRAEFRALHNKVDALASSNGHAVGWFSTKGAAAYLDTTEVAIRSLVFSGKLEARRNGSGKLTFRKEFRSLRQLHWWLL